VLQFSGVVAAVPRQSCPVTKPPALAPALPLPTTEILPLEPKDNVPETAINNPVGAASDAVIGPVSVQEEYCLTAEVKVPLEGPAPSLPSPANEDFPNQL
jgi:hypothetical protein